jgi:hypothetical protein
MSCAKQKMNILINPFESFDLEHWPKLPLWYINYYETLSGIRIPVPVCHKSSDACSNDEQIQIKPNHAKECAL